MLRQLGTLATAVLVLSNCCLVVAQDAADPPETEPAPVVSSLPAIDPAIHEALQDRSYAAAVAAIDELLKGDQIEHGDYLLYLKARALTHLDQLDDAMAAYRKIESDYPKGAWVSRARFGQADVLIRGRNYREAGDIYQQEAERLLSRGRKDDLAQIYLEYADRYFEGEPSKDPSKAKRPDYAQALTYYQEAVKLGPTIELRQRVDFRIALCLDRTEQADAAVSAYQKFLQDYGREEPQSGHSASIAVLAECSYRLGEAQLNRGLRALARRTWQDFLADWDQADEDRPAELNEYLAKAEYRIAHTYGLPAPGSVSELELAVAAAESFAKNNPEHELVAQARLEIAQGYAHHGRNTQAVQRLTELIGDERFKDSKQIPEARRLLGQAYLAQVEFDSAIRALKEFLEQHPTDPQWSTVQRMIVDAEYAKAKHARDNKRYTEARELWQTFLNKYPLDARAAVILYQFGEMKHAAALEIHLERVKQALDRAESPQSIKLSDECRDLYNEAIADWRLLVSKYPKANESSLAAYKIGTTLEDRLGLLKEALEAYKQVSGSYQAKSQQRITRLTTPQLEIVTERKFRSDERPVVKLTTRNIEKLTVKVYRIDMTDYFRKMHLASGVETLDIALIDADHQFEHAVGSYEPFRRIDQDVSIPMDGPGVTAVTVASDEHEATTMLVVSDLDVIVKSSRNELFLFAENMRTGRPVDGVSVLVSDGDQVFAEELTGRDGILQKSFEQLADVSDLRVFAIHEGHMASTVTNLDGLDFAVGLTPRGYLYTDRPAYRAGQLVNVKGIVRWVDQDRFTFKSGEKYRLDIYDARGRLVHTKQVALNGYGTINDNLVLPATSPQGKYRVHLHQPGKTQSYETSFTVSDYRLEPVQIQVETERDVFYRGEKVRGTITLKYYHGVPLAAESVTYSFGPMGEQKTAQTDANGQVAVEFETQPYRESQPLTLNVVYPGRSIKAAHTVYLATRGFAIEVTSPRSVYINGETFDAGVSVFDPAGEPVQTKLSVEVFERTVVNGSSGERLVATHAVETDPDSGLGRATIKIDEGGRYFVRATGVDQFGNQVSGQKPLLISGVKDSVRLRILADKHDYRVGDDATIKLHWREAPALALATYEGATILGYQLVRLEEGENDLRIPMEAKLAPNFNLSIAVMERNRYHAASSPFRVARRLTIELSPDKEELQPGENLTVGIQVTDPQGKPQSAELSLGLIQANLLDVYREQQGAVDQFFSAGMRKPSVRQSTSCTFRYTPQTRGISRFLLAESERIETLQRELAARRSVSFGLDEGDQVAVRHLAEEFESIEDVASWGELVSGTERVQSLFETTDAARLATALGDDSIEGLTVDDFSQSINGLAIQLPAQSRQLMRRYDVDADGVAGQVTGGIASQPSSYKWTGRDRGDRWRWFAANQGQEQQREQLEKMMSRNGQISQAAAQLNLQLPQVVQFHDENGNDNSGPLDANYAGKIVLSANDDLIQSRYENYFDQRDFTVNALTRDGRLVALNGRDQDELQAMADVGLSLLPGMVQAETGFWDPVILADANGKASVTITMPARSTSWQLRAKGVGQDALAGEATAAVLTRKDVFGDLKLPTALTAGDSAVIPVEVHNSLEGARELIVTLKTIMGERSVSETRSIDVQGPGIARTRFPIKVAEGNQMEFRLSIHSGDESLDQSVETVPVRPYGYPVFGTSSGASEQSTLAFVDFGSNRSASQPALEILVGPSIDRTLLDAVIGVGGSAMGLRGRSSHSTQLERAASDILGGIGLMKMIGATRTDDSPEAQALAGRISSALASIISAQRKDGSWSWSGSAQQGHPDRYLTSRVMWALSEARQAGFSVPNESFAQGQQWLKTAFAQSSQSDREGQTILLHGMAAAGCADFAFANRLHRERNALSPSGLLHLALVFTELNRKEMAVELLRFVKLAMEEPEAATSGRRKPTIPWMSSPVERQSLYLLALQRVDPGNPKAAELADSLLAARVDNRWLVEKANGPAVMALSEWYAGSNRVNEKYKLTVFVNDQEVEVLNVDPAQDGSRRIRVPAELLVAGQRQKINFDLEGRGKFSYSAVLSGFIPADQIRSTTKAWTVDRRYEPREKLFDGRVVPRGFGVVNGSYSPFRNEVQELPVGVDAIVTLSPRRRDLSGQPDRQYDYLVLTEPIPAGCTVLEESVTGSFDRFEIQPGAISFYIGDRRSVGDIRYRLTGYVPGQYRVPQTVVRSFYDPQLIAISAPKALKVLPQGQQSADPYRLTPDELYHLGKLHLGIDDHDTAHKHLTDLITDWTLDPDKFKDVVQMLFQTSLARRVDGEVVKYFETIKERMPEVEVRFEDILRVALSYRGLGEYERSYLVYRATVQGSFERESRVAGFLTERNEFVRSVQVMESLLRDYPAESYLATGTYALAQEVYRKAPTAAADERLKAAGLTRVHLINTAAEMLNHFVSTWPEDPAADQASFACATALLDLDLYEQVIERCQRYAERYPDSRLLDSFWYLVGYSHFEMGQHDEALKMCRKVAETRFKVPQTGALRDADNKWEAIYIMGQVHHSLGHASDAIEEYAKVKERFSDASDAIEFFSRKAIEMDEVTTLRPDDPTRLKLKYRNIAEAALKVYRIDLMKFGLMQRNLDRITAINLAGIKPHHEAVVALGDGKDYRDRERMVDLPLEEEGAYLIVCRGENLYASGLVLVSPLQLEVQEDVTSGRVRVTVKDVTADAFRGDVHVKVIGSANDDFESGQTDLRGLFVADDVKGSSTIIALADDDRYAFYRGELPLQGHSEEPLGNDAPSEGNAAADAPQPADGKLLLRGNVLGTNGKFQMEQKGNLDQLFNNDRQGVKPMEAY